MDASRTVRALAVAGAAVALAAACGSNGSNGSGGRQSTPSESPSTAAAVLKTASSPVGTILVDKAGKTVYVFAIDKKGVSNCSGACLQYWPAVPAPATLPSPTSDVTAQLGSITRSDGTKQLTVAGFPVYTFAGDSGAGQINGQGKNASGGLWWVVTPSGAWVTKTAATSPSPSKSKSGGGY